MRALDEDDNASPLTEVIQVTTNPVPPAPVMDLTVTVDSIDAVTLSWTAPGDDHKEGVASAYEVRYTNGAMNSVTFPLTTTASSPPPPSEAGAKESMIISGLDSGTLYRFALVTKDEAGNASYLSNVASARTESGPDDTPPTIVTDLRIFRPEAGGLPLRPSKASATSAQLPDFPAANLIDGSPAPWAASPSEDPTPVSARVDLGDNLPTWVSSTCGPRPCKPSSFPPTSRSVSAQMA